MVIDLFSVLSLIVTFNLEIGPSWERFLGLLDADCLDVPKGMASNGYGS